MNNKKKQHQTHSFNDTVAMVASKVAIEQVMPAVRKEIEISGHVTTQRLARILMNPLAEVQLSQICLMEEMAEISGITFEEMSRRVAIRKDKREDEATEMEALKVVEKGAKVLLSVVDQQSGKDDMLRINKVQNEVDGKVQTFKELEDALIGMEVGQTKMVTVNADNADESAVQISVKVETISRKKEVKANEQNQG